MNRSAMVMALWLLAAIAPILAVLPRDMTGVSGAFSITSALADDDDDDDHDDDCDDY